MSNASHRHAKASAIKAPRAPWGTVALVAVLIVALFGGVVLASALATPANASTSYLTPAVTAARVASFTRYPTTVSSSGMGINPAAIAAPAAGTVGRERNAAATVDHGYTGNGGRVTQWQHVLRHCRKVGCTSHVPDAMRRDMGIKPGQAYRVHWGDTTTVWVKLPHGRVRTIKS